MSVTLEIDDIAVSDIVEAYHKQIAAYGRGEVNHPDPPHFEIDSIIPTYTVYREPTYIVTLKPKGDGNMHVKYQDVDLSGLTYMLGELLKAHVDWNSIKIVNKAPEDGGYYRLYWLQEQP